jgi:hypothetical protein
VTLKGGGGWSLVRWRFGARLLVGNGQGGGGRWHEARRALIGAWATVRRRHGGGDWCWQL